MVTPISAPGNNYNDLLLSTVQLDNAFISQVNKDVRKSWAATRWRSVSIMVVKSSSLRYNFSLPLLPPYSHLLKENLFNLHTPTAVHRFLHLE